MDITEPSLEERRRNYRNPGRASDHRSRFTGSMSNERLPVTSSDVTLVHRDTDGRDAERRRVGIDFESLADCLRHCLMPAGTAMPVALLQRSLAPWAQTTMGLGDDLGHCVGGPGDVKR